jgi:hypothetical protein
MIIVATEDGLEINGVVLKDVTDLKTYIAAHQPEQLAVAIGMHAPTDLSVSFSGVRAPILSDLSDVRVFIDTHGPAGLTVSLYVDIGSTLLVKFGIYQTSTQYLLVTLKGTIPQYSDLSVYLWAHTIKDLAVSLGIHPAKSLSAQLWAWHISDVSVLIDTVYPRPLEVSVIPEAEPGQDLLINHHILQKTFFEVEFDIWKAITPLNVWIYGMYGHDFGVSFTMGGYKNLTIPIPMTTGYRNLAVTLKPASRIMTTIIPVYIMEMKDLYISINQGWPCGFGSSYRNFSVVLNPSFFLAFSVDFKTRYGGGSPNLGIYLNTYGFGAYINEYPIVLDLPQSAVFPDATIVDMLPLTYDNQFDNIVQDIMQINLSWPRIRWYSATSDLSVSIGVYVGEKLLDVSVSLFAVRADVPRMPTSQPIVMRSGMEEPIYPTVFQVKEIELWADDPPDLVRLVEVVFGEQVHEYYWVSKDQRAYAKKDWEKWSLMTRGYLPHAEYSGQIDYVTLYEISDMKKYDTIDSAMRAMISGFVYRDKTQLVIDLIATGSCKPLQIFMDIWGKDRLSHLIIRMRPAHPCNLAVEITCV